MPSPSIIFSRKQHKHHLWCIFVSCLLIFHFFFLPSTMANGASSNILSNISYCNNTSMYLFCSDSSIKQTSLFAFYLLERKKKKKEKRWAFCKLLSMVDCMILAVYWSFAREPLMWFFYHHLICWSLVYNENSAVLWILWINVRLIWFEVLL